MAWERLQTSIRAEEANDAANAIRERNEIYQGERTGDQPHDDDDDLFEEMDWERIQTSIRDEEVNDEVNAIIERNDIYQGGREYTVSESPSDDDVRGVVPKKTFDEMFFPSAENSGDQPDYDPFVEMERILASIRNEVVNDEANANRERNEMNAYHGGSGRTPLTTTMEEKRDDNGEENRDDNGDYIAQQDDAPPEVLGDQSDEDERLELIESPKSIFSRRLTRQYGKGSASDTVYEIKIPEWKLDGSDIFEAEDRLKGVWGELFSSLRNNEGVRPDDLIRLHIDHPALTAGDIKINLRRMKDMNVDAVMNRIGEVVQSKVDFRLDSSIKISVGIIRLPSGGASKASALNVSRLKTSHSLRFVNMKNGMKNCLAESLCVCRAKQEVDRGSMSETSFNNYKNHKTTRLNTESRKIHMEIVGDMFQPATMKHVPAFEKKLSVNILVVSASHSNEIIWPEKCDPDKPVYSVYLVDGDGEGHFHAILALPTALGFSFFCFDCMSGHTESTLCDKYCKLCKTTDCNRRPKELIQCDDCKVYYNNELCYESHLKKQRKWSLCNKIWRCESCKRTMKRDMKERHICGSKLCLPVTK